MAFINRAGWAARSPKSRVNATMNRPSTGHWNGPAVRVAGKVTWSHDRCFALVRGIQNFHMDSRGWADIAYNFVVCPHGHIFEGRGRNVRNGANGTSAANANSHAIMWLSGQTNPFTDGEKLGYRQAQNHVATGTTAPDSSVGHRDHKATECPGAERYSWLRGKQPIPTGSRPSVSPGPVRTNLPTIRRGSRGEYVLYVQLLAQARASQCIAVDGIFGPATEEAVKNIQRIFKLKADGIVGPKTWRAFEVLHYGK